VLFLFPATEVENYRWGCLLKQDMSAGNNTNCCSGRLSRGNLQGHTPWVFLWVPSRLTLPLPCTALSTVGSVGGKANRLLARFCVGVPLVVTLVTSTTPHLLESANSGLSTNKSRECWEKLGISDLGMPFDVWVIGVVPRSVWDIN